MTGNVSPQRDSVMKSFNGAVEELQARVSATGRKGSWTDITNGKQFRCNDGAILNWFPSTGRVQYQGPEIMRDRLQADLSVDPPHFPMRLLALRLPHQLPT